MTSGFCTRCGVEIESFDGLTACPRCGTTGVPCAADRQVEVSINVHELRILCIWAENWALSKPSVDENLVYAIAARLRRQLGELDCSLTMAEEFQSLRDAGFDFKTDHPAADQP